MRVTRIEGQKKRPGRKNIYIDGAFLAGVSAETLVRLALRTGDEISPEQLRVLQKTEELVSAKNTALRYLSARPRTQKEIRDKLREKEFADGEISRTIEDLKSAGLINDAEFARMFIRDALALRPAGRLMLKRKLLLLGVATSVAEDALSESLDGDREREAARTLAEQFMRKYRLASRGGPQEKIRSKLAGYLGRRGYSWDVVQEAIQTALQPDE